MMMQPQEKLLKRVLKNLTIKRSSRARRLALRLDPKARAVTLVIPRGVSEARALAFASDNQQWIEERLSTLPEPIHYEDGAVIPVLGRNRRINIFYNSTLKTTHIDLKYNEIVVFTNKEDPSGRILRFLKELARETIADLAREKAALIGKRIRSIHIRDTKSRWGSCAADGSLSFSWRLIHAPYESLDYVVAHEVAHLRHMNHAPRFWALCEDLSQYYDYGKDWMRANSQTLMRFGG